ncbi:MORC family CW-type zinc finger protein 3 [Camellia lanceoleosa]|uniref:MORC family CW-type zinc finger protein 3 n=1 Tax=Camellia lanceoleosa TaxID=1840588 RepID=A0ACC0GQR1_9ERIC|nr:MORC family CW-type zinc finger protein 3 [Camellia lanceoleosa]
MEDTELEEGEACYYKDDTSVDPDIALSYLDEKLHSVLGHFQKDFEGGVSAENLGAKFGGYGSFLPTYQRSPSVRPQSKTPQRVQNFSSPRSPDVLPIERAPQNSTAPSDAESLRLNTASRSLNKLHTARASSGDISAKQNSCLSSAVVIEKFPMKHEPVSIKPVNPTDQRTLKVRIKVGSDNRARKNAAIYSGLGLISPSSSMGNSPDESGGMSSECQENVDESLHSILQSMTSFPVPGGFLLSPLHESLLCLARKEKLSQNSKPVAAIKSGQEHAVALADDSASLMGDSKVPKDKKAKIVEKSDNLIVCKQELGMDFDDKRSTIVKCEVDIEVRNVENESLDQKGCFSNDTKPKRISNSVCNVVDSVKGAAMAPGIPREAGRNISLKKREVTKDGMEDRLSTGLVMESESLSDQKGGKYEKAELRTRSSSMEKICESRLKNYHRNVSADLREDVQSKGNKVSDPLKADTDVSKCRRDHNVGAMDHSSYKVGQTTTYHGQVEAKMPHGMVKFSFEGKNKLKGSQSNGKSASEADESLMTRAYEVPKEKKKAAKMHNSKSQKDIQNVHDNRKDLLPKTRVEQMNNQINSLERPFGDKPKRSNPEAVEKEQCASLDKLKEISTRKKVDTQLTSETCLKEAANDVHPSAKGVTSEMEPTSVPLVVIEENWVLCDRCHKWRLLPDGTKPDQLPENWLCSMLNWLPGMNRCDISEEETTKALYALYQLPLPESQNNLEKHVDRTAAGASSADALLLNQNHLNVSSHGLLNPQKKKQGSKGTPCAASNGVPIQISGSTKNIQEEMVKCRSLNDMKQPISESNLMNNCSVEHLSKSRIIPMERNTHKQKEKHVNSGDAKQKRLKSKREADQYVYGTTKKIKADVAFGINKYGTTEPTGNIDKVGCGLPTKAAVRSTEKHNGHFYSKDAKSDWKEKVQISAKKWEECASVSLHTGSLDMKNPRKSNGDGNIESNRYWEARREVFGVPHSEPLGFPVLDFQDNNSQKFGGKFKSRVKSPSEFQNGHLVRSDANNVENPCAGDLHASDHCNNENRMNKNHYHDNPEKSGKLSSLLSKDNDRISMNNFERVKSKVSDPPCEMDALNPKQSLRDEVEIGSCHVALPPEEPSHLKCRIKPIKDDKSVGTKGSGKWESDNGRENQLEFVEHNSSAVKFGAHSLKDSRVTKITPQQNLIQDFEGEVQKSDPTQVESRGGNSQAFLCHAGKQDPPAHVPHSAPRSLKGSAFDVIPVDSSGHGDLSEVLKQPKNAVNHLGHPVPNRRAVRDASSQVASSVLKEAEDLRDNADRYKGFGFGFECNLTYFLAALKFLHGASLLETCNGVSSKHGEMSPMQIYSNAAKLCEICAHEYEKRREMASAALAYKCMEVAYMRVVCCKNASTNRDRHDLQASLQMAPQGESPSSSASDVDNLNNQAMVDKAALSKSIGAHAGNHAIVAHNRPNFVRLLDFTKDVNSAMDASRKSQDAFAAANVILEEAQNREVIISIKRVIDFSFQDIEELISLVRLAIEAISRHGFTGNKD